MMAGKKREKGAADPTAKVKVAAASKVKGAVPNGTVPNGKAPGKAGGKGKKEKKEKDPFGDTSPMGLLKKEAAEKLGLVEKVQAQGWGALSSAESGRVGALMNKLLKERSPERSQAASREPSKV